MINALYPPVLPSKQYSFLHKATDSYLTIQFEMPAMTALDVNNGHCQVSIKYATNGRVAILDGYSPDRASLYITALSSKTSGSVTTTNPYFHKLSDGTGNTWELKIPTTVLDGGNSKANTWYSIQIRFGSSELWTGYDDWGLRKQAGYSAFSAWKKSCTSAIPSKFGEWSNTTQIFCYEAPSTNFQYNFYDLMPQFTWTYSPTSEDPIAKAEITYTYQNAQSTESISETLSGTIDSQGNYTVTEQLPIIPFYSKIVGTIKGITQNNTKVETEFSIPTIEIIDSGSISSAEGKFKIWENGTVTDLELSQVEQEDAILAKQIVSGSKFSENTTHCYTLNIYRCDLLTLKGVKVASDLMMVKNEKLKFKDYTPEMGERYEYIFGVISHSSSTPNQMLYFFINPVSPYGSGNAGFGRLMKAEGAFLSDPNHQLRLIGNLNISALKRNTSDNFQTTLGSKYPFYSRNSQMNYRSFGLTSVISINFDPTSTFMRLDPENGLMWDTGNEDFTFTSAAAQSMVTIQLRIKTNQDLLEQYKSKIGTAEYLMDATVRADTDANIAKYYSLIEADKSILATYKNTRGLSELIIWDEDIYEENEISLSRRRVTDKTYKLKEVAQEMAESPYGLPDKSKIGGPQAIFNQYLHRDKRISYDESASDRMVYLERVFKDKVMEWLSNGQPKLFRSENLGNMIVMVSNPSFAPVASTGMRAFTLSCTLTEIADYNLEGLTDYKLIPSVIESDYEDVNPYDFAPGKADPNVNSFSLAFSRVDDYYIGPTRTYKSTETSRASITRNLAEAVVGQKGVLTFSLGSTVTGLSINASTGVLTWRPTTVQDPQLVTIKVTDTSNGTVTATTTLFIDKTYEELNLTAPVTTTSIPTALTGESFTYQCTSTGGLGNITYSSDNLPLGLSLDSSTGVISGTFEQQFNVPLTTTISVSDESESFDNVGVTSGLMVFGSVEPQLVFDADYLYSIPTGEVGTAIDTIDFSQYVSGGDGNYTFSLIAGTGERIPAGIVINATTGILSGTPTTSDNGDGVFEVKVTDGANRTATAHVVFQKILEKFLFVPYVTGKDSYNFSSEKTYDFVLNSSGVRQDLHVGDSPTSGEDYWIDLMTANTAHNVAVQGGEPWEKTVDGTTVQYYKFEAVNLMPNFELEETTGIIKGIPSTSSNTKAVATIKAKDKRGKYAKTAAGDEFIKITISPVKSAMYIKEGEGIFNLPSTIENNHRVGDSAGTQYIKVSDYGFEFSTDKVIGGTFTAKSASDLSGYIEYDKDDFPGINEGVTKITVTRSGNVLTIKYGATGTSLNGLPAFSAQTSYLYIRDDAGRKVALKIEIGEIYKQLKWEQTDTTIYTTETVESASQIFLGSFMGDRVIFDFDGISGGEPNYYFSEVYSSSSSMPLGVSLRLNENPVSTGSGFSGTLEENIKSPRQVIIRLTDELGQHIDTTFTFSCTYTHLSLSVNKATAADGITLLNALDTYTFIVGKTNFPASSPYLQPFIVTGGSGQYEFSGYGDILGGATVTSDGKLLGSVTKPHPYSSNLKKVLIVKDKVTFERVALEEDCWSAPIYEAPIINSAYIGTTISSPLEKYGSTSKVFTTIPNIFDDKGNPSLEYGEVDLPNGLIFNEDGTYSVEGKAITAQTRKVAYVWVKTQANSWTTLTEHKVYIAITINGPLQLSIDSSIEPGPVGDAITSFTISPDNVISGKDYVSGGVKPYTFKITYPSGINPDPGIKFTSGSNSLTVSGTRTKVVAQSWLATVTVTDGNGEVLSGVIAVGKTCPALYFRDHSDFDIPELSINSPLTKTIKFIQNLETKGVYGGTTPYSFYYDDLSKFGTYTINNDTGLLTGTASSSTQSAGTAQIIVRDAERQSKAIQIAVGQVYGPIYWRSGIIIPLGVTNVSITPLSLSNYVYDGYGSVRTYSLSGIPNIWSGRLAINSSTGIVTGTYPSFTDTSPSMISATSMKAIVSDAKGSSVTTVYLGSVYRPLSWDTITISLGWGVAGEALPSTPLLSYLNYGYGNRNFSISYLTDPWTSNLISIDKWGMVYGYYPSSKVANLTVGVIATDDIGSSTKFINLGSVYKRISWSTSMTLKVGVVGSSITPHLFASTAISQDTGYSSRTYSLSSLPTYWNNKIKINSSTGEIYGNYPSVSQSTYTIPLNVWDATGSSTTTLTLLGAVPHISWSTTAISIPASSALTPFTQFPTSSYVLYGYGTKVYSLSAGTTDWTSTLRINSSTGVLYALSGIYPRWSIAETTATIFVSDETGAIASKVITLGSVYAQPSLSWNGSVISVPKGLTGTSITPINLNNYLVSGYGSRIYSLSAIPTIWSNLSVTNSGYLIGTYPSTLSSIQTARGLASDSTISSWISKVINLGYAYEKIYWVISSYTIPLGISGYSITAIPASYGVSGGEGTKTYSFTSIPSSWSGKIAINSSTGRITGTYPTAGTSSATATVKVSDESGSATATLTLAGVYSTINWKTDTIIVPIGVSGQSITSVSMSSYVKDGYGTKTYSLTSIPSAWSGYISINTSTGVITGTYPAAGTGSATLTVRVSDSTGSATKTITLAGVYSKISWNSTTITVPKGTEGQSITQVNLASYVSNGYGTKTYTITSTPTAWSGKLSLDSSTGILTGTYPATGTASATLTVKVSDSTGSASKNITLAGVN